MNRPKFSPPTSIDLDPIALSRQLTAARRRRLRNAEARRAAVSVTVTTQEQPRSTAGRT
jgi:hypothetical protein